jgi:hypothetical protein
MYNNAWDETLTFINENSDKFEMIGRLLQLTKEDINDYIKE